MERNDEGIDSSTSEGGPFSFAFLEYITLTSVDSQVAPACGIVVGVFEFLPPVLQDLRAEKKLLRID
jgi:hypothetical protein